MKKNVMILLFGALTMSLISIAQPRDEIIKKNKFSDWVGKFYLNHAKGVKTLSFRMGGTKFSKWGYIAPEFNFFVFNKIYLNFSPVYDKGTVGRTDYINISANITGVYTFYELKNRYFFNVHAGLRSGLEKTINKLYQITEWNFVYGGVGGVEIEAYFGRLGLSAQLQEFYSRGSILGAWHYSGTLGLKFII